MLFHYNFQKAGYKPAGTQISFFRPELIVIIGSYYFLTKALSKRWFPSTTTL